ncbi:DNA (cytosine-5-)-methyltransferase [Micromonospora arborensis]|uniref:DNA cytosine methyltransferase n=1 Tax=Micromonospora arborensis TaxID=2116518 RepID=UPI003412F708
MPSPLTPAPLGTGATRGFSAPSPGLTFVEFFAGVGLIHEAIAPLGWSCLLANDNDPRKVAAYKRNYSTPIVDCDIRDLPVEEIPTATLATASFPCIDLSQAGGRRGINGEHSGIVWSFLDHIAQLAEQGRAPQFILLENVAGLLTLHEGASIDLLLRSIADLGYAIDLVQVDARHFVPQTRNRVFIIAVRDQSMATSDQMPDMHIRRYKVQHIFQRNRDLPWVFFDFPELPTRRLELRDVLVELPEDDSRWWNEERTRYFWDHLEHDHRPKLEAMVAAGADLQLTAVRRGRRRGLREQIFNLRFDGLASCLRTPKGGSSIQFVVRVRNGEVQIRRILGSESARLQGVALKNSSPNFLIPESEQEALFAFGDAVCVPAVRWVFENSIQTVAMGLPNVSTSQLSLDLASVA